MKPADPRDVRRHNLSLVLREVAERGPRSRATIALETGLNKTTVSSLVAELIELGLLRESGRERPGAVGRPAQSVEIDPAGPFVLGLEVNVDYLAAEARDEPSASGRRPAGTTVAVPGLADGEGRLVVAPNLHWLGQEFAEGVLANGGVLVIRVRRPAR